MEFTEQLRVEVQRSVAASLAEDIGTGDLTARLIPASRTARGRVITREDAVLCGTAWFDAAFAALEPDASVIWHARDGERLKPGQLLCEVDASARALLTAERTALNFVQLLSGTATLTATYVAAVAGTKAKIVDTRKTLPGLRLAQKYAVRIGGGTNHRVGLYDGILIKENHIISAGSIKAVIEQAKSFAPSNVFIEVEEFEESPVFARKGYQSQAGDMVLREGALYVRGVRKPETVEIRTSLEMRRLLELALQRRLERFFQLTSVAGYPPLQPILPNDDDRFAEQLQDFLP